MREVKFRMLDNSKAEGHLTRYNRDLYKGGEGFYFVKEKEGEWYFMFVGSDNITYLTNIEEGEQHEKMEDWYKNWSKAPDPQDAVAEPELESTLAKAEEATPASHRGRLPNDDFYPQFSLNEVYKLLAAAAGTLPESLR